MLPVCVQAHGTHTESSFPPRLDEDDTLKSVAPSKAANHQTKYSISPADKHVIVGQVHLPVPDTASTCCSGDI
ncbi:unnamed protein product [Protopolystoma xenopodis]|uniref:Uncharacterized protein n=1 Tax=Protopolystoma xenopodis TaxID=117903 RepID=A0A3S4ZQC1_9PLAT|nr:unnamed protein product [Protopolystoma xenopodis]